jgi:uncharacterized membrane protein SpoIIM required for sporulation/uncharacterized RDD family membrane protein YckC
MTATRAPRPDGFSRRVSVETPEHVVLEFELAGFGSRLAAAAFDFLLQIGLILVVFFTSALIAPRIFSTGSVGWITAMLGVIAFVVIWGYGTLFEGLTAGRTPGKRRLGIRVVTDTGHLVTLGVAAVRNLLRIVDAQPLGSHLIGLLMLFFQRHSRRLGDLVAGTMVVRDERDAVLTLPSTAPSETVQAIDLGAPVLSDPQYQLLERLVGRIDTLDPAARKRIAAEFTQRIAEQAPNDGAEPEAFLVKLYENELAKRQAKAATRSGSGGARTAGTAERFVALRQGEWEAFRALATDLLQRGLSNADSAAIVAFARDYRAVASDLARARTYGADARVIAYLERIVGAGHNALYGLSGVRRVPLGGLLLRQLPAAVYDSRRLVLIAFLCFLLPGIAGYALIRERPAIAAEILPFGMVARAEAGGQNRASGRGYAEAPSPYLPMFASSVITNNVQVAFSAFALGALAGVGTLIVLAFNGLFFGSVLALFANYGLADWLLTFVAAHGVLELTAIFIAGAAGLNVGRAIVAPGDLARRDALIVHGRMAIKLVGASACLLILAGLLEGFLSASDAPAAIKLGASAASAVLLLLLYAQGRRASASATTA